VNLEALFVTKLVAAELGYTRSIHYGLNSVSFSLGLNIGRLVRGNAQE